MSFQINYICVLPDTSPSGNILNSTHILFLMLPCQSFVNGATKLRFVLSQARGDRWQAFLALVALGNACPQSCATSGFSLGQKSRTNAVWTIGATAGCLCCLRSISGCLYFHGSIRSGHACSMQVLFVKTKPVSPRYLISVPNVNQPVRGTVPILHQNRHTDTHPQETWYNIHWWFC